MNSAPTSGLPVDHDQRLARASCSLTGLSVGDAFGQQFLGIWTDAERYLKDRAAPRAPWWYTDDTVMAMSIVDTLKRHGHIDQDYLAQAFADRFAAEPGRGYGRMAQMILGSIGMGEPWKSVSYGAFDGSGSMGNGGAMRVAPLGAYFADDLSRVAAEARASAEVTHAHPDGQAGAIAVGVAAAVVVQMADGKEKASPRRLLEIVIDHTPDSMTRFGLRTARTVDFDERVETAVHALGNGSQITAQDTVPFALWCSARHMEHYEDALWTTASGLGDIDTTCAIVGGIVSLFHGESCVPAEWLAARGPLKY